MNGERTEHNDMDSFIMEFLGDFLSHLTNSIVCIVYDYLTGLEEVPDELLAACLNLLP
jgi:hypothetical protein